MDMGRRGQDMPGTVEGQDLPSTYLAHHELESVTTMYSLLQAADAEHKQ